MSDYIGKGPRDWLWWFERRWLIIGPLVVISVLVWLIRELT